MSLAKLRSRWVVAYGLALVLGMGTAHSAGAANEIPPPLSTLSCDAAPKRFDNGQLEQCTLVGDYRVPELTLPSGSRLSFSRTGALSEAFLGGPAEVHGQLLPSKATLFFDPAGRLRHFWLGEESSIQGHRLRAMGMGYTGYLGHMLYANGKLRAAWLAGEELIDGIPCASKLPLMRGAWHAVRLGAQAMVWFYDDGRLRQAMLARDVNVQGHPFKKGELISLRRDGTLDPAAKKLDWSGWNGFRDD